MKHEFRNTLQGVGEVRRIALYVMMAVSLLMLSAGVVLSEETLLPADKTGKWSFSMNEPGPGISRSAFRIVRGRLEEITRLMTASPALKPPVGFEARFWGSASARDRFHICKGKSCPPAQTNGTLALLIGPYEESGGRIRAAFNTPSTMDLSINYLGQLFAFLPVLGKDKEGYLFPEPKRSPDHMGMPTYMNNGHAVAVLTKSSRPLWLPVSMERYLKAAIYKLEAELGLLPGVGKFVPKYRGKPIIVETTRTWKDSETGNELSEQSRSLAVDIVEPEESLNERLKQLKGELEALQPEHRRMQARVDPATTGDQSPLPLLPAGSSDGVGVVTPNLAFFKPSTSPAALQLVTLHWKFSGNPLFDPEGEGITGSLGNRKLLEIYRTTDWQKLIDRLALP